MKIVTSLTLFFPMYNERETVARMTSKALDVLETLTADYEVIIVDDASHDGSEQIADELARQHPQVRVIHHPQNLGYGAALRTGLQSASKELVFYTDCDEPVDLQEIGRALALIGPNADLVLGYRIKRYDTLRRFVYSKVYNWLCRLLFGVRARDVNFSFKLLKREVLEHIHLSAGSVFIDGELLAEAVRCGYEIVEIPVEYFPRRSGKSSFDSLSAAFYTLEEMLAYWRRTRARRSS
ncbi:MAG: glycosyltransferase family 2 protein [Chloroflexi bacterium]|nr:MAG: glycosyltransferase family 2 protein [Chloroflexota bacterium]HEY71927.1 glycosyltransferase family 2 protein [Thermoflexia bacterium]